MQCPENPVLGPSEERIPCFSALSTLQAVSRSQKARDILMRLQIQLPRPQLKLSGCNALKTCFGDPTRENPLVLSPERASGVNPQAIGAKHPHGVASTI